jgi:hypothetical protein
VAMATARMRCAVTPGAKQQGQDCGSLWHEAGLTFPPGDVR